MPKWLDGYLWERYRGISQLVVSLLNIHCGECCVNIFVTKNMLNEFIGVFVEHTKHLVAFILPSQWSLYSAGKQL